MALPFFGTRMNTDFFPVLWPLLSFPNLLAYWEQHFHSIILKLIKSTETFCHVGYHNHRFWELSILEALFSLWQCSNHKHKTYIFVIVQLLKSYPTLCEPMNCSTAGFPVLHYLPNFVHLSVELVMPSNYLILCCSLSSCPQSFPASESLHQVAKVTELQLQCQSFQFSWRYL